MGARGVEWINELEVLDQVEPWLFWWLTRPSEHPYNTYFRPCNPGFPVFAPVGTSESEVESLIVKDVGADEASPPVVDPSPLEPENCDGMQILPTTSCLNLVNQIIFVSMYQYILKQ